MITFVEVPLGKDDRKHPVLPFVLCHDGSDPNRLTPRWLQFFKIPPAQDDLRKLFLDSTSGKHQTVTDYFKLPSENIGEWTVFLPGLGGLRELLEREPLNGTEDEIQVLWRRLGSALQIGVYAYSRKAAQDFVDSEGKEFMEAKLPWENGQTAV